MKQRRSFALVLSIMLLVMLTTTGASIALTAASESTMTSWVGRDLDHRLAVDSFLVCLPHLLQTHNDVDPSSQSNQRAIRLGLTFGNCRVKCDMRSEASKRLIANVSNLKLTLAELRTMARAHNLPPDNIKLRPVVAHRDTSDLPPFIWFDQVIEPTALEEIFRLALLPDKDDSRATKRTPWSDLVSFWKGAGDSLFSLDMETTIGNDSRRWYLVASLQGQDVELLYRGPV